MTRKHFFTASAIALSLALSSTAWAVDTVDANGNQLADNAAQTADDDSNVSTTGAISENSGNTVTATKTDNGHDDKDGQLCQQVQ
jgi:hypothetical protein